MLGLVGMARELDVGEQRALRLDHEALLATFDQAAGRVVRALRQRLEHVVEHHPERRHLRRIGLDVDLFDQAAVRRHVRDAGHAQQGGLHHPLFDRAQRHRIAVRALERVAVDLADRGRERAERGVRVGRQVRIAEALEHLLACVEHVDAILERHRDDRQAEQRDRALVDRAGYAVERALERDRDPALDFLGGLAGVDRDDLDRGIGRIGERLDREVLVGRVAEERDRDRADEHEHACPQRRVDQSVDHGESSAFSRCSAGSWLSSSTAPRATT